MSIRIKFNEAGFRELLTGSAAQRLAQEEADRMAQAANSIPSTTSPAHDRPYYKVEDASDGERARRRVITDGPRSMAHEAKTQALLKGL